MKKTITLIAFILSTICTLNVKAQEISPWMTGVDLYSNYVWRGIKIGSGPAMQPTVKYSNGGFSIGAWGNYCFSTNEATEADLFATYNFTFGKTNTLAFTLTDYYFPPTEYFDSNSHYLEPMVTLGIGRLSVAAAYMTNAEDTYLEAGYTAGVVTLFAGAGNGQYTKDASFDFCNLGLKTSKSIKVSDSFSIPVNGAVILNPSTEQLHIVVGISL